MRGQVEALGLNALVRDLCQVTHAVSVTLRREANAAGAEDVLAWQTGYPSAVSFASGHPRSNPGELSAAAVLARGDADAALVVGSDPLGHLPQPAAEHLRAIPFVSVDVHATRRPPTRRASRSRPPRPACTAPASCTGSTACRSRCARCSSPRARATRTCSQAIAGRLA